MIQKIFELCLSSIKLIVVATISIILSYIIQKTKLRKFNIKTAIYIIIALYLSITLPEIFYFFYKENKISSKISKYTNHIANLTSNEITKILTPNNIKQISDFEYEKNTITEYKGKNKTVNIPEKINNISIKNIDYWTFIDSKFITNINIPNSINNIEDSTFEDCENLATITLSNNLTSIKYSTFKNCKKLTGITVPNSVNSIDDSAFENCENLTNVTLSNSLISIKDSAFKNCKKLTEITIPNSVNSIEDSAFENCENLTTITLSNNLTNINDSVFKNCKKLTIANIPKSVTTIGISAFENCENLTNVNIQNSKINISSHTFKNCKNLIALTLLELPEIKNLEDFKQNYFKGTNSSFEGCNKNFLINKKIFIPSLRK